VIIIFEILLEKKVLTIGVPSVGARLGRGQHEVGREVIWGKKRSTLIRSQRGQGKGPALEKQ